MKHITTCSVALTFAIGMAFGNTAGYWQFDGDLSATGIPALAGQAGVFEKGKPPVFDSDTPGSNIWNGATFSMANACNRSSLRFANDGVTGAGAPVGGEIVVPGTDAKTQPLNLTVEAFVKVKRQSPRHALIASKRRNGQTGASWSLSIDP
ncbi:MAG: hypothetical protein WA117_14660, partial [Verrucomicrobiia bacterium]